MWWLVAELYMARGVAVVHVLQDSRAILEDEPTVGTCNMSHRDHGLKSVRELKAYVGSQKLSHHSLPCLSVSLMTSVSQLTLP